ncbi:uncharacterized protein LOC108233831 [Kryptolebias marmoratus]|uniref:uncharacterized protein LOC108233831 n=1 Tax=Kryptolebias marmoratus TaxID=37003 RepID=UPI0007F90FBA|nr:uncharacterized protein LOC108233831 [Kryptolebias marmoratus]XP_024862078.1 uncharacterized protein LOC108233831 [Kryptolebias marmoratus]
MACRRRQQSSLQDLSERYLPNTVNQLTFKYMMCKMDSSSDSDSEISPRWSDTSTLGCVSSAAESGTSRRTASLAYKPAGRHAPHFLFLDPYDGSSEDSDRSNPDASISSRQTRQQGKGGGCRLSGRRRRPVLHHPAAFVLSKMKTATRDSLIDEQSATKHDSDVQMKCGSDSELWDCDRDGFRNTAEEKATYSTTRIQTMDVELQLDESGFHTRASTPHPPKRQASVEEMQMLNSCFERSPGSCNLRSLFKRKVGLGGAEVAAPGPRKRQCVDNMEDEQERKD